MKHSELNKKKNIENKKKDFPILPAAVPNQCSAVDNPGQTLVGGHCQDVMEHSFQGIMEYYFIQTVARLEREYSDILKDSIQEGQTMQAMPGSIKFISRDICPYHAQKARRIPLHHESEKKKITDDLQRQGVIMQQRDNYTLWCSFMTFLLKKNNWSAIGHGLYQIKQTH